MAQSSVRRTMDRRGFGLVELLIATAIGLIVLAVLLQFAASAHTLTAVQGETADLNQRLRVAVETMRHDLTLAGAGPTRGPSRGPLNATFPAIVPARAGDTRSDPEFAFHSDRISVLYVRDDAPQTRVMSSMATAGSPVAFDGNAPGCRPGSACDFAVGTDVLIYEASGIGGAHEVFTIGAVDAASNLLTPAATLSWPYSARARLAGVVRRTYYLDAPGKRLMVYDGRRSDLPLVDHVVDLRFAYYGDPRPDSVAPPEAGTTNCAYAGSPPTSLLAFLGGSGPKPMDASVLSDGPPCGQPPFRFDADLLRIRRVSFTIRLEAESAQFRARGTTFLSPGVSRASARSVADLQTTVDVAPRNLASPVVMP
jgi:prepilin-type N-terminal cleavage/methylation domain-containing protein